MTGSFLSMGFNCFVYSADLNSLLLLISMQKYGSLVSKLINKNQKLLPSEFTAKSPVAFSSFISRIAASFGAESDRPFLKSRGK